MALSPRLLKGSAFTPRSISGLALWLDASDASTLFQNSDGTVPATATSDPVGYWADKSGNGRHAVQATAGSRPTVSATALNGKKQLGLVSQHLRGPSTTWTGSASIYWVGKTGQSVNGAMVFGDGTVDQADSFHAGWINTQGVGAFGNGWGGGNAPRAESPSAWRNTDIVAGVTLSSTEAVARVNGATTNTIAALTGTLSQASAAEFYIGRESTNVWNNLNGSLAELLIYQPALNALQRARLERYLAARWGITLAPQVANADAQNWIDRVYANGGTVSSATAQAVNQFCVDLESASLRSKMLRLNLFCGTGLNAALVPLYRSASFGGSPLGNATDNSLGSPSFLITDYNETGASGGLLGNGSSKYLNTGLSTNDIGITGHVSAYHRGAMSSGAAIRAGDATTTVGLDYSSGLGVARGFWSPGGTACFATNVGGHYLVTRRSATDMATYVGGALTRGDSSVTTNITATQNAFPFFVFALNNVGSPVAHLNTRLQGYSIGLSMTQAEATTFSTVMTALQTSLERA